MRMRPATPVPRRRFLAGAGCALIGGAVPSSSPRAAAPAAPAEAGPETWTASWIAAAEGSPHDYGVYLFRRTFELPAAAPPARFVVHVSGDNRYQLYCNGRRVCWGPARGDLANWRYETVDLAPHLRPGKNLLAAVVWNFGEHAPMAQISHRTGLVVQGDGPDERQVDTGRAWKAVRDHGYEPIRISHGQVHGYYVVGPGDRLHGYRHPWGWEGGTGEADEPAFDDRAWPAAVDLGAALPKRGFDSHSRWFLVPRELPAMEESAQRLAKVREVEGLAAGTVPAGFPAAAAASFVVPAHARARLLLDQGQLTTGHPELVVSGGRGARVRLTYVEALHDKGKKTKGHRDEVAGKELRGGWDEFFPEGGKQRAFSPLWWRTWRYLELVVETGDAALTVEDLRGRFVAYPFERRARFGCDRAELALDQILDVGWRTARLCAHESYMDCPYYEQLQYAGDTRIQALVSLFTSGDDRLMRTAIYHLDDSRTGADPTTSRYPARLPQYIPPFSLWWIGMVHDHHWYRDDPALVARVLPGVRAVLAFFARHRQPGSPLLGPMPWWNFVDWAEGWPSGTPPGWARGSRSRGAAGKSSDEETFSPADLLATSAPLDLQHLLALDWAAALERAHGSAALAEEHARAARALRPAIRRTYWDRGRRLFADTGHRRHFSQHTNALAVLAGVVSGPAARALMERTLAERGLVQASIYFRYYVNRAAVDAGLGDRYLDLLDQWRQMLAVGLTTWAEQGQESRSDCHAWGASPNVELFRTVLGIDAAAPGFRRVVVRPHLGPLRQAKGSIPHPRGEVTVELAREGGRLTAEITLPEGTPGELVWGGTRRALRPGKNGVVVGGGG